MWTFEECSSSSHVFLMMDVSLVLGAMHAFSFLLSFHIRFSQRKREQEGHWCRDHRACQRLILYSIAVFSIEGFCSSIASTTLAGSLFQKKLSTPTSVNLEVSSF